MSFFNELKRRNVFKVAAAYVIVGWLIMNAGEVMSPALNLPDWVNSMLAFFLILGFPLAMVFAWAFEMTPDGIKKEKDVDRSESVTRVTGAKLNRTITIVLVLALGFFIFDKFAFIHDPGNDFTHIKGGSYISWHNAIKFFWIIIGIFGSNSANLEFITVTKIFNNVTAYFQCMRIVLG